MAIKNFGLIAFSFCITLFFVLSHPLIKIHWYAAPLFPIMCLLLGCSLGMGYKALKTKKPAGKGILLAVFLSFFLYPYYKIYENNLEYLPKEALEMDGYAIRTLARSAPELKQYKIFSSFDHPAHFDPVNFYIKGLNHFNDYKLELVNDIGSIKTGDLVMTSQEDKKQMLFSSFSLVEIDRIHQSFLYKVGRKL